MLSAQLKSFTKDVHHDLEKEFMKQLRSLKTTEQYAAFLQLLYGFYSVVEQRVYSALPAAQQQEMHQRRKSEWLANDIRALTTSSAHASCKTYPPLSTLAEALGALYVLEGSTLGGQIIAAVLKKQLNLNDSKGLTFFEAYGDKTQAMWEKFKLFLDQSTTEKEYQQALNTAANTFITFKNWIQENATN